MNTIDSHETEKPGITEILSNLEQYLPGQEPVIYEFAKYLSTRAHDSLVPQGFDMMAHLAIEDLKVGVNGFTGKPINNRLVGCPPRYYIMLGFVALKVIKKVIYEQR